ncbi:hypothetical protein DXT66_03875 [Nocardia farcinica]|nr:hypothetical protein DXT66_03875 [Nocardia farcinica]
MVFEQRACRLRTPATFGNPEVVELPAARRFVRGFCAAVAGRTPDYPALSMSARTVPARIARSPARNRSSRSPVMIAMMSPVESTRGWPVASSAVIRSSHSPLSEISR